MCDTKVSSAVPRILQNDTRYKYFVRTAIVEGRATAANCTTIQQRLYSSNKKKLLPEIYGGAAAYVLAAGKNRSENCVCISRVWQTYSPHGRFHAHDG